MLSILRPTTALPVPVASLGPPTLFLSALVSCKDELPILMLMKRLPEASGFIFAFLLSPTKKVRRSDGSHVPYSRDMTWKNEFSALYKHALNKRVSSFRLHATKAYNANPHFADMACVYARFLFVLLRWGLWDLPHQSLLYPSSCAVESHCPYVATAYSVLCNARMLTSHSMLHNHYGHHLWAITRQ